MRSEMGHRDRNRQLVVEDEYWRLVLGGVGTVVACRRVGSVARPAIGGALRGVV